MLLLTLAACEEDQVIGPTGNVVLNINAVFAGNPLELGVPYLFGTTNQVKFDQLNFFISNVALLEAETDDETDLLEIDFADFSDNTIGEAESFTFSTVPAVKYRGIKIGIGVPSSLNKSSVSGYGAGHPLKQNFDSHFWKDGGSFFFMKLAGMYDLNGNGVFEGSPTDNPFELFPAKNGNYATVFIDKVFTLENGKTANIDLTLDILKLLQTADNQALDFADPANLSTYNPENDDLSSLLMGNFEKALEVE